MHESVSFEMAQFFVGPGKNTISIVLRIATKYVKHEIPIPPMYNDCQWIIHMISYTIYKTVS